MYGVRAGLRPRFSAVGGALCLAAASPVLPPPAAVPLAPAPADPILAYADAAAPDDAFRAAVAAAISREPEILQALAQVDEAEAQRREARAALRPRLDLNVDGQRVISRSFANDPQNVLERSRPTARADAALSAEQLITDFGATRNRLEAARAREEASGLRADAIAEDAAFRASGAWYEVYTARTETDLTRGLVDRNRKILSQVRDRASSGIGAQGDVARVQSTLAQAEVAANRAVQAAEAAGARYQRFFGAAPPVNIVRPATVVPFVTLDTALAAVDRRPDVQFASRTAEGARRDLRAARSDRAPRVTAGIDAAKFNITSDVEDHDVRGRLTLRQSLYRGGASEARVDAASARLSQAEFGLARARDDAERDTRIAWSDLQGRERELDRLRGAYIAARQTRDLYVEQFRVTRGNLIELLRAETDLQQSASLLLRGVGERDLARLRLLTETARILPYFGGPKR